MNNYIYRGLNWIESFSPTESDLQKIADTYSLDPFIINDILAPTPRMYSGIHGKSLYIVLHFPAFRLNDGNKKRQELDMVIQKDFLMSVRYNALPALELLSRKIEADENLSREQQGHTHGYILAYTILKEMYATLLYELDAFSTWLEEIDDGIHDGKEREMVSEISLASRELTEFRATIHDHEQILASIGELGTTLFGTNSTPAFETVLREFRAVKRQTRFLSDIVTELRETNNSLVSTKQNEIMKVLTLMAFVTFPLSLIATIFGMNTQHMPIIGAPHDFWIIMAIMGAGMFAMFMFFRHKHWL